MTEDERESLREKLIQRRDALLSLDSTNREAAAVVELDQSRVGRLSRMDALQAQAMSKAAAERRANELRRIHIALKRIDQDDYGRCEECDEPIALGRLEIDPAARLCIRCAE